MKKQNKDLADLDTGWTVNKTKPHANSLNPDIFPKKIGRLARASISPPKKSGGGDDLLKTVTVGPLELHLLDEDKLKNISYDIEQQVWDSIDHEMIE